MITYAFLDCSPVNPGKAGPLAGIALTPPHGEHGDPVATSVDPPSVAGTSGSGVFNGAAAPSHAARTPPANFPATAAPDNNVSRTSSGSGGPSDKSRRAFPVA
jgi:hypothetical protein